METSGVEGISFQNLPKEANTPYFLFQCDGFWFGILEVSHRPNEVEAA
jgi:hypothetical protein